MEETIYPYGWHLIAFLDICGQREELRQLQMPKTEEEYLVVQETLKNTAGVVLSLRKLFRDYFESFTQGYPNLIAPEFRGVSDSLIVSVPLKDNDANVTLVRCYCALSSAATLMISSLASRHALRGGIELGVGIEISQGEIYGSASERAYLLESHEAVYPRILIGDELCTYLSLGQLDAEKAAGAGGQILRELIRKMKELITKDADNRNILDYLGPGIVSVSTPNQADILVKRAYHFVLEQHQYWISAGNTKLGERYANLRQYFESRLPLWGLSAAKS
jgi:hypothetical protein